MINVELVEALKEELEKLYSEDEIVNEYDTKFEKVKRPKINTGWYTQKVDKEDFPYVLISPVDQVESGEKTTVNLTLIFGIYSKNVENGWKDVALLAEKVRQYLKTHKFLAKKYEINQDLRIEYPDDQPYPIYFCAMSVSFNIYNQYNYEGGELTW